jgi:hypothetical protein
VVAADHRGQGLASTLVDAVARDHAERRGMLLHCRNDFPAHQVWDKLDFLPVGERPGKSFDGKALTRWFRPFGRPDLFTYLEEADSRPVATMDACVFFDLVALRPKPLAQQLRADWLGEHVRLAVTDQLLVEIRDGTDAGERRRQRTAADQFRMASTPRSAWSPVFQHLREIHPDAPAKDRNDLVHVAQSIALGAGWLITTDGPLARRYGRAASDLGLRLATPSMFLREIDEQARGDRYRPVDLAGTAVTRREVDANAIPKLAATFVNHQPVHASTATSICRPAKRAAQPATAAGVASIRPRLTSPVSVSNASNVICLRCTSNPATIAIRASSKAPALPSARFSRAERRGP